MKARVIRRGGETMIALPKQVADEAKLLDEVDVEVQSGGLRIAPVRAPRVTLEELVAGITDENRHEEADWGAPSGNEVW